MMKASLQSWDKKQPLINELTHVRDLLKQLKVHLLDGSSSSTTGAGFLLLTKILSSFDRALSMVNLDKYSSAKEGDQPMINTTTGSTAVTMAKKYPRSVISSGTPPSNSNSDELIIREQPKRRKMIRLPRWTDKVQVCSEIGFAGPPDDGYDWRKYGQKYILGAKYPRSYYRCTYHNAQRCLAIKQVQRSDEDPSIFSITYEGKHTCIQVSHGGDLITTDHNNNYLEEAGHDNYLSAADIQNYFLPGNDHQIMEQRKKQIKNPPREILLNFQTGGSQVLKFDTQDQELITGAPSSSSSSSLFPFNISSIGISSSSLQINENPNNFSSSSLTNNFMAAPNFSPPFISSPNTTFDSSFFCPSNYSPILDLPVFSLDPVDFQSHFLLDTLPIFN